MANKLKLIFFFLTFLIATSASAFDNYIVYDKIIANSQRYGYIEPILNSQKELNGLIYSDTISNRIVIEQFQADSLIILELTGKPLKTVHYYSDNFDTLFCFTLNNDKAINSTITKFVITDLIESEVIPISCYSIAEAYNYDVIYLDLKLDTNIVTGNRQILFQKAARFDYHTLKGTVKEVIPTSAIINPVSCTIITQNESQVLLSYPLFSQDDENYLSFSNIYYFYDFRTSPTDTAAGSSNTAEINIYDKNFSELFDFQSSPAFIYNIFLGNFQPSTDSYELIYCGNSLDLAGYYNVPTKHIGCYSFSSGFAEERWYNNNLANIKFEFVYREKDYLIGRRGNNEIIFLDYLNGNIEDSTNLYHNLTQPIFFDNNSTLNLFGRSGDTVFIHRFDVASYIGSYNNEKEEIPLTFTLIQNHPNPFNGETRLEFEVEELDNFTLKIYNVLGQEIKHLASGVFAPGVYQYYWNGKNESGLEQASGVYFARLQSEQNSQMIKLIYIK